MRSGWEGTVDSTGWESCPRFRDDIWLGSSGKEVSDVTGLMKPPDRSRFRHSWIILTTQCYFFSICNPSDILFMKTGLESTDPLTKLQFIAAWAQIFAFFELLNQHAMGIFQLISVTNQIFWTPAPPTNRKKPVFIKRHQQKAASDTAQIQSCWRRWAVVVSPDPPAASARVRGTQLRQPGACYSVITVISGKLT